MADGEQPLRAVELGARRTLLYFGFGSRTLAWSGNYTMRGDQASPKIGARQTGSPTGENTRRRIQGTALHPWRSERGPLRTRAGGGS